MRPIHILLVEDNEGDIFLTKEAIEESKIFNTISVIKDGSEVMSYLMKKGNHTKAQTPDLILLDLNLPKRNGLEVLQQVKSHSDLKAIPVIMLTSSSSEKDVMDSYKLYANCFITKPIDAESFLNVLRSIENFWISIVKLPKLEV